MRLTNTIRNAFITSVMHELPKKDFSEEAKKIVEQDAIDQLPESVKAVWKSGHKPYITVVYVHGSYLFKNTRRTDLENIGRILPSVQIPGHGMVGYDGNKSSYRPSAIVIEKLTELCIKEEAQFKKNQALETKLKSVVYGATTVKQLSELLPEFKKYLPKDVPSPSRTLPVAVNLVSEFTQAGWPKSASNLSSNGTANANTNQKTLF